VVSGSLTTMVCGAHGSVRAVMKTPRGDRMSARDEQYGGDHYKKMDVQPWDVIDSWPQAQQIGFYRGNALKYLMRAGSKDDPLQEIQKARHYMDRLIEVLTARGNHE
jgi:hypothetical protein